LFHFYWSVEFCGCRGDDFIARKEFTQELSQASWGSVYKTLVQYIRLAERTPMLGFARVVRQPGFL